MKKYFYSLFASAAMVMGISSCSQEAVIENSAASDDLVEVTFTTDLEGANASRAIGDGTTAKYLYFGAYLEEQDANNAKTYDYLETLKPTNAPADGSPIEFVDKKATVKLRLVKGQTYRFLFWAQSTTDETYYDVDFENHKVTVNYGDNVKAANNEARDAFYVVKTYKISGPLTETITLKRPFAQVNVGIPVGELAEAKNQTIELTKSDFTFNDIPNVLEVFEGAVSGEVDVTYTSAAIPESNKEDQVGDLKNVKGVDYEYIAMNYILAGATESSITSTSFTVYTDSKAINTYTVPNLPVTRNWRTNIIGNIMSDAEFNIVIDPIFVDDHNYPENTVTDIKQAAKNGGRVVLEKDEIINEPLTVNAHMVIDLNGKTLTYNRPDTENTSAILFRVENGGSLTFEGVGAVESEGYVASANAGGKIFANGNANFTSEGTTIFQANGGEVYVKAGRYEVKSATYGTTYTLNHVDAQKNNGIIEVTGGSFFNFDPADNAAENPKMSFVKSGYASFKRSAGGNNYIYDVRPATGTVKLNEATIVTSWIIPEGETLNLDLGGNTLTVLNNGLINHGTMTVKNGTINSHDAENSRRNIYNYGEMTIEDVTFNQYYDKKGAAINNEGKLTINNATVNAVYYSLWTSGANAETIIKNANFTTTNNVAERDTWAYAVSVLNGAKLTIEDGTFTGNHGVISSTGGSTVTLKKGTYYCTATYTGNSDWTLYTATNGSIAYSSACILQSDNTTGQAIYETTGSTISMIATDFAGLDNEIEAGGDITFGGNIKAASTLNLNGGVLDGAGYTLTADKTTAQYMIKPNGGTIKNLTITGYNTRNTDDKVLRGIYVNNPTKDIVIDNVTVSGVAYSLNTGAAATVSNVKLTVTNSTLIGWASMDGGLASASFNNCHFGIGTYFDPAVSPAYWNGALKPYVNTTLENCTIESGFLMDLSAIKAGCKLTLKNCKSGATIITKDNFTQFFQTDGNWVDNVIFN